MWSMLKNRVPVDSSPVHLLWTLLFLKQYNPEHIMGTLLQRDEKTLRKWIWLFVTQLALIKVVIIFVLRLKNNERYLIS